MMQNSNERKKHIHDFFHFNIDDVLTVFRATVGDVTGIADAVSGIVTQ